MDRIVSIQYLRALAALAVVAFHALEATGHRFLVGAAGVDVFFVISGFIMGLLVLAPSARPASFLWRRFARIAPFYWLVTLAALAIAWVKPTFFYRMDSSLENAVLSLLFIPHTSQIGVAPVLWQGWTLEYEMAFYVLCAAALFAPMRSRLALLAAVLVALAAFGWFASPDGAVAKVYTGRLLLEFAVGLGIAALWRVRRLPGPWASAGLIAVAIAAFAIQQVAGIDPEGARVLLWGAPAALLVLGALGLEAAGRVPTVPAGLTLGDASYALYLTHTFVIAAFSWFVPHMPTSLRLAGCIVASSVLAVCVHHWLERPLHERLQRRRLPRTAAPLPIREVAGSVRRP